MTINKNNTKNNNSYNVIALNTIATKWNVSKQYARLCIKGDRNSLSADAIRKDYFDLVRKINVLLSQ